MLPLDRRPVFEEGVRQVFLRWTALRLAVENEWGGASSAEKAQLLMGDVLEWFYRKKGRPGLPGARRGLHEGWRPPEHAVRGMLRRAPRCCPPRCPHSGVVVMRPCLMCPCVAVRLLLRPDHYADELEEELDDAISQDFNVQAEDGSPRQVGRRGVALGRGRVQGWVVPRVWGGGPAAGQVRRGGPHGCLFLWGQGAAKVQVEWWRRGSWAG